MATCKYYSIELSGLHCKYFTIPIYIFFLDCRSEKFRLGKRNSTNEKGVALN